MIIDKLTYQIDPSARTFAMGPKLCAVIESQLTRDLRNYRIDATDLKFDWSQCFGAGHSYSYMDGTVENFNRIIVFDANDNLVADGCMDFIANRFFFIAYWDLVTSWHDGEIVREKKEQGMPMSVWRQLPEALMTKHIPRQK